MADETKPEVVKIPDEQVIAASPFKDPVQVSRNGVTTTLSVAVGKKGKWANTAYGYVQVEGDESNPDITSDTRLLEGLTFIGKSNLINICNIFSKRSGQDIYENSIGAEGTPQEGLFIMDACKTGWADLEAAALKLSELDEAIEAAQKKFQEFMMTNLAVLSDSNTKQDVKDGITKQAAELSIKINGLRQKYALRSSKRSKEVNTNEVRPQS